MEVGLGIGVSNCVAASGAPHSNRTVSRPDGLGYRCVAPAALASSDEIATESQNRYLPPGMSQLVCDYGMIDNIYFS